MIRVCRRCTKCSWRQFGDPKAECPEHERSSFTDHNKPYMRQPAQQAPGFDRAAFDRAEKEISKRG